LHVVFLAVCYSGVKTAAEILGCTEDDLLKKDESQQLRIYDAEDNSQWPDWIHQRMADKKKRYKNKADSEQMSNMV
jgi:hypothetical protein